MPKSVTETQEIRYIIEDYLKWRGLTDDSMADALHRHSELSASDGTPDAAIQVDASGYLTLNTSLKVYYNSAAYITNTANTDLIIGTNNTARVYVKNDGKVNIGTGTFYRNFNVLGQAAFGNVSTNNTTSYLTDGIAIVGNNGSDVSIFLWQNGVGAAHIGMEAASNTLKIVNASTTGLLSSTTGLFINSSGFLGILGAPSNPLHIQSTASPQVRAAYDADSYWTLAIADGGDATLAAGEATGRLNITPGASDALVYVTGAVQSTKGRIPTGSIYDSNVTQDTIFDALKACIPNTNDYIGLRGGIIDGDRIYSVSKATRYDSTNIYVQTVYLDISLAAGNNATLVMTDGSSSDYDNVSISW